MESSQSPDSQEQGVFGGELSLFLRGKNPRIQKITLVFKFANSLANRPFLVWFARTIVDPVFLMAIPLKVFQLSPSRDLPYGGEVDSEARLSRAHWKEGNRKSFFRGPFKWGSRKGGDSTPP